LKNSQPLMRTESLPLAGVSTRVLLRGALLIGLGTFLATIVAIWWFDTQAHQIRVSGRETTAKLMADGVAMAIAEDVIAHNYAELENRLKQTLADPQVVSGLVADRDGQVLSYMRRESASHEAIPIYAQSQITLPTESPQVNITKNLVTQWLRLDVGIPIGWLRLEIADTEVDNALIRLREKVSIWLLSACMVLLTALTIVLLRTRELIRLEESAMQARNDELKEAAYRDSLTGLPNRHLLLDRIEQATVFCQRHLNSFAVCFMDLDGFKTVNDLYGHEAGDQVLREVGRRLGVCVRKNDTIARLGGDEFVILLAEIHGGAGHQEVLSRILSAIRQPIALNGHGTAHVSASIGVTLYPADNSMPSVLLEHADQAMYQAKRSGKNRWTTYAP